MNVHILFTDNFNFQEDLYPETQADIPAITADEWWTQRKNADPVLMSMAEGGGSNTQGGAEELVVKKVRETRMQAFKTF